MYEKWIEWGHRSGASCRRGLEFQSVTICNDLPTVPPPHLIPALHHPPVHNLPKLLQVRGAAILVIQIVRMLPHIKRQNRL